MRNPMKNSEGYHDPTAYYGMREVVREDEALNETANTLIRIIKNLASLSGFEIIGRIKIKHKESGREFK